MLDQYIKDQKVVEWQSYRVASQWVDIFMKWQESKIVNKEEKEEQERRKCFGIRQLGEIQHILLRYVQFLAQKIKLETRVVASVLEWPAILNY